MMRPESMHNSTTSTRAAHEEERTMRSSRFVLACLLAMLAGSAGGLAQAENIDPVNDGSQYAWGENIGWCNAEPNGDGGDGIEVADDKLTGWMWCEAIGWISLSCENTASCATVSYGVDNDGSGGLTGYAWSESAGWINFNPVTAGVSIDPATGEFDGYAWGENVGWINFSCTNEGGCDEVNFGVVTEWTSGCDPIPDPPIGSPLLLLDRTGEDVHLSWSAVPGATEYDVVAGDVQTLRSSGGNFALAVRECLVDDTNGLTATHPGPTPPALTYWYLVRAHGCGGIGSYDSGGDSQWDNRDSGIDASSFTCP